MYEQSAAVAFSLCLIFVIYLAVSMVFVLAAVYAKVSLLLFAAVEFLVAFCLMRCANPRRTFADSVAG